MPKYDGRRFWAETKHVEDEHRAEKKELKATQQSISAMDKIPNAPWRERSALCNRVDTLRSRIVSGKDTLTSIYMARAAMRGRLHLSKRVWHKSDGTKEVETWSLEDQARSVEDTLAKYVIHESVGEDRAA